MERTVQSSLTPDTLAAFLRELSAAARKLGIYPPGHPVSVKAAERPFQLLKDLMATEQMVVFAVAEGTLLGCGIPLDAKLLNEGLGKVIVESGLHSISFEAGVTPEEFELFLSQINIKKEQRDLPKFFDEQKVRRIKAGRLQYQVIRDGERVISEDDLVLTGGGSGGVGGSAETDTPQLVQQIERTMTDVLRKHPELLLQILTRKLGGGGRGQGGGTGDGIGSGDVHGSGTGFATGSGSGGTGGSGTGPGAGGSGTGGGGIGAGSGGTGSGGGAGSGVGPGNSGGGGNRESGFVEWRGRISAGVQDGLRALGIGRGMGSGGGGGVGSGSGVRFTPEDYKRLKETFSEVDNEELLGLLVAALRMSFAENDKKSSRAEIGKALTGFRDLLAERESLELLPRLKAEIEQLDLVDNDYLRELLSTDATPKKIAHIEIENFKSDFFLGAVDPANVEDVVGWLETISDLQYTEDFVKKFYAGLDRQGYELTETQHEALLRFASICAENSSAPVAGLQLAEIKERLAEPTVTLKEFQLFTDIIEKYYQNYIDIDLYDEAASLLDLVVQKLDSEVIYEAGVAELAAKVHQRMTSAQLAESLVARLAKHFELVGKPMIPLLEKFNSLEPILVFAGYLNHRDRGVRITLIRILSSFGEKTINAFKLVLSDRSLTNRPANNPELPTESWYKLRNILFVLGNIPHPDSVGIAARFSQDSDERVVMESLIALEKLGGTEGARAISRLLQHPIREISLKALHALGQVGSAADYPYAEDYFLKNVTDRTAILPVLIKLDKQRSLTFLAQILLGESQAYHKLFSKPDEDLNELIVKTFIMLRSVIFDDILRKYVKQSTRSLFGQLRKMESVKLAERYLKTVATTE